ncbi:LOW QUALITY PROTEIN: embigin [Sylvia atricapilla]|uniref:LOW QUALITY PROTEIN: embigin n=1 Tax=Sylvia atricapilla TaxID=48155 RepID=UPI003395D59A
MPATFSGRCLGCLLLLLLCTRVSGGNPADSAMTTQDSNQTEVNSVTKMQAGYESSGPAVATDKLKPASKQNSGSVSEYEIVLSDAPLEKIVPVPSPTKVELTCKLDENSNLKDPQMTWKKGSETVGHSSKIPDRSWTVQLTISDKSHLGSYTCILTGEKEIRAVFHLQVPKVEGREKPIITYERDRAVMVCKTEYNPKDWTWYINVTNGTGRVPIDTVLPTDRFIIKKQSAEVNRLEILKLTQEDRGVYWCEASFDLGTSEARFELRVLSIAAPLKPFIAVVIEVAALVTTIALFEVYSKRKGKRGEKEFDQIEQVRAMPTEVEIITATEDLCNYTF